MLTRLKWNKRLVGCFFGGLKHSRLFSVVLHVWLSLGVGSSAGLGFPRCPIAGKRSETRQRGAFDLRNNPENAHLSLA